MKETEKTEHLSSRYTLLDLIGTGGMAEVYRAKLVGQRGFEKPLVIKQLLADVAGDDEVVANFIDEARLAALLQHENIACVYDFGEQDGKYFIAMEYLFGKDLHTVMGQAKGHSGTVGVSQALYVAAQICAGMDYAHNLTDMQQQPLRIIHRDLTPHNVFLTYDGKIKIIDFGVAKAELFDNRTRVGVVKGKITYMSPEHLVEGDVDARSDIFSIGILLYEMLTGARMYQGDTATLIRKCINVEYQSIKEVLPEIDSSVCKILHKALQKNKEDRYQSCGDMLDDINDYFFRKKLRLDNKVVKTLLLDLFRSDYDTEIQRLSPGESSEDGGRLSEYYGDDDKTVFVNNPYAKSRFVWRDQFNRGTLLAGVATVICVVALAYVNMVLDKRRGLQEVATVETVMPPVVLQQPEAVKEPVVSITPFELPMVTVEVEKEINDEDIMVRAVQILLDKAELALEENKLTLPADSSAYTYYRKVQELEPGNTIAKEGMVIIADRYAAAAEKKLFEQNPRAAIDRINKGLGVMDTNERLLSLQQQIMNKEKAAVDALLQKAQKAFAARRYTIPEDDCAYRYYQDIAKIRPGSPLVKKGLRAIADRYASMGDKALQNLNLNRARSYVSSGLNVAPNHPGLLELQADLQKSKTAIFMKGLKRSFRPLFN